MFFFGKTDIGLRRGSNQDSFIAAALYRNTALCVVCDGMGGANGGNIASKLAADVFHKTLTESLAKIAPAGNPLEIDLDPKGADYGAMLNEAASAANSAVYARANSSAELRGMGTTLVAALVIGKMLYAVNIGDSRLYIGRRRQTDANNARPLVCPVSCRYWKTHPGRSGKKPHPEHNHAIGG